MTPPPPANAAEMRMKILEIAGGDVYVARALQGVLWEEYCNAGQPLGPSEEAMFQWIAQALQNNPAASPSTNS